MYNGKCELKLRNDWWKTKKKNFIAVRKEKDYIDTLNKVRAKQSILRKSSALSCILLIKQER